MLEQRKGKKNKYCTRVFPAMSNNFGLEKRIISVAEGRAKKSMITMQNKYNKEHSHKLVFIVKKSPSNTFNNALEPSGSK